MPNKICFFLILFAFISFSVAPARAEESVSVIFPSTPLFSISDGIWFPGKSLSKVFTVENLSSNEIQFAFTVKNTHGVGSYYSIVVISNGEKFYSGDLFSLSVGQMREFEVELTLLEDVPPEASGSLVAFELEVQVLGEDVEEEDNNKDDEDDNEEQISLSGGFSSEVPPAGGGEETSTEGKIEREILYEDGGGILGEVVKKAQTKNTQPGKRATLLDKLSQNNPNLAFLVFEELVLLAGIVFFSKRSRYFRFWS